MLACIAQGIPASGFRSLFRRDATRRTPMMIVIAGEKGGSGKTTLATNLAVAQAARSPVLLVNCDPQESSPHWVEQRRLHHPEARLIPCVSMRGERIGRDLESLEQAHETLILDTGGRDSAELRAALTVADIAVLPVRPNQLDFATLPK